MSEPTRWRGVQATRELTRGSADAAGLDLFASLETIIPAKGSAVVETGCSVALPPATFGLVTLRSGHGFKRDLVSHPGIIDPDYRGEIKVKLFNLGDEPQIIAAGERFAQLTVLPYVRCEVEVVDELSGTARGDGGFGSTGLQQVVPADGGEA